MRTILACLALVALSACAPRPDYSWYKRRCEALGGEVHLPFVGGANCQLPDSTVYGYGAVVEAP